MKPNSNDFKNSLEFGNFFSKKALKTLFSIEDLGLEVQYGKKDLKGDIALVLFPLTKLLNNDYSNERLGQEIGDYFLEETNYVKSFKVIGGFLNFYLSDKFYLELASKLFKKDVFDFELNTDKSVMVEYSSPNTNKPLHLGHIRNNLLGHSLSELFGVIGYRVIKTQIINDRGIHICKSMVAWMNFANGATPQSTKEKGDHFVGKYYVLFDKALKEQTKKLIEEGYDPKQAQNEAPIMKQAREVLKKWEEKEKSTIELWSKMNSWVYEGFNRTYNLLGISFDDTQFESQTYLLGKKIIEEGLEKKIFYKKEDGSVWVDLTKEGLDEKLLLRSDGTSVYITQDLGTALERFEKYNIEKLIYVVGQEQEYHFKVLFLILKKMGYRWAKDLHHLSYGMVELPSGKMKSREGTVVDADELIEKMHLKSQEITKELGKLDNLSREEVQETTKCISMGALKYHLLKVDPKKGMLFDPQASIDFKGNTGPYIQYTYARICSLRRNASNETLKLQEMEEVSLGLYEKNLIKLLEQYTFVIFGAAKELNVSKLANYAYELAKMFNDFYQNVSILSASDEKEKVFRLSLSLAVAAALKKSLNILGIELVEQM